MKLLEINWEPTKRQLRQFAAIALIALPFLTWFWSASSLTTIVASVVGIMIVAVGLARPLWLRPAFILVSLIALPIGLVVSELAILFIYFGLFLPIGICFRVMGRDKLDLTFDPG